MPSDVSLTLSLLAVPSSEFSELGKIDKQTAPQSSTAQQLSSEWSLFKVLSIESNVTNLSITQGFTPGIKGLTLQLWLKHLKLAAHTCFAPTAMNIKFLIDTNMCSLCVKQILQVGLHAVFYLMWHFSDEQWV